MESPYLRSDEAAAYLRFGTRNALYGAMRDRAIPRWVWCKRGGRLLFDRRAIDRWLSEATPARLAR